MKQLLLAVFLFTASLAVASSPLFETGDTTNRVAIVNSGYDAMLLRVHLFRNATKSINVQTFILTNDECGRLFMYELIQAAKRGVKVRMLADQFVSNKDCDLAAFLATVHPNLEFKYYRPAVNQLKPSKLKGMVHGLFSFRDINQRMHNKLITVDGKLAITGGRNIENSYYHFSTGMNFKDRDVLVRGPVVRDMERSFDTFWNYKQSVAGRDLKDVKRRIAQHAFTQYDSLNSFRLHGLFDELSPAADDDQQITARFADQMHPVQRVEFISDKPGKNNRWWLRGDGAMTERIREVLKTSEQQLIIQSPYLILNQSMRSFFLKVKKQHPELKVVISSNSFGSTDNTMAYSANYKWRSTYIEKLNFEIHEYKPLPADLLKVFPAYPKMSARAAEKHEQEGYDEKPFLCIHAKSFVLDDRVAFIGTFNLDPRSVNLNTEVGLLIYDETVASLLKEDILNDAKPGNSWVIAKRDIPLSLDKVNAIMEQTLSYSPVDLWPLRNTSSFELRPGKEPVSPQHPEFYQRYEDAGSFPGDTSFLTPKSATTRMMKMLNGLATPIL